MSDRFAKVLENNQELIDYLTMAYDVTEERADELIKAYSISITIMKDEGDTIHYIGDQIAEEAALEPLEFDDEEIAEEADDE
jgi:hypothetical protein